MIRTSIVFTIVLLLLAINFVHSATVVGQAVAVMHATSSAKDGEGNPLTVTGTLTLEEYDDGSNRIFGTITGLLEGEYGFHIHQYGDVSLADGTSSGTHFNPFSGQHSNDLSDMNRHVGDMGNITFDSTNTSNIDISNSLWQLHGDASVVGRTVIIHQKNDDGTGAVGNAGGRYAHGVIGIKSNATNQAKNDAPGASYTFAVCELRGDMDDNIKGRIVFSEDTTAGTMAITASVCGLPDGYHGIHVHQFGDMSGSIDLTGAHYNPTDVAHGLPTDDVKHFGDIGNIYSFNGSATFSGTFTQLTTRGSNSIIGRAVIVHNGKDMGKEQQPSGNSGAKIAKCVIGTQDKSVSINTFTCAPREYVEQAIAMLVSTNKTANTISGTLLFNKTDEGYRVTGTVSGLPANSVHGFHIHQFGDIRSPDGSAAGDHYNPYNAPHSNDLSNSNRHVGDMGNITSDENGVAVVDITDVLWTLSGPDSIVGRALIIHQMGDNGSPTGNGNAGSRYAQAVIGIQNAANNLAKADEPGAAYTFATAEVRSSNSRIYGRVTFSQSTQNQLVTVRAKICGLPVGQHGFHVHTYGDVSVNIDSVGGHYDPETNPHRYPDNPDRHVGDMGNITTSAEGTVDVTLTLDRLTLVGSNSIIGRSVIVHSNPDQGYAQQPAGNSGTKIAVGIIGTRSSAAPFDDIVCPSASPSESPSTSDEESSAGRLFFTTLLSVVAILLVIF